jgi:hypothetical protein
LVVLVRHAVVEALVVQGKVGVQSLAEKWAVPDRNAVERIAGVKVEVNEAGDVSLTGDLGAVASGLQAPEQASAAEPALDVEEIPESATSVASITTEEARQLAESWDHGWKNVPLTNDAVKFAVCPPTSFPSLPLPHVRKLTS